MPAYADDIQVAKLADDDETEAEIADDIEREAPLVEAPPAEQRRRRLGRGSAAVTEKAEAPDGRGAGGHRSAGARGGAGSDERAGVRRARPGAGGPRQRRRQPGVGRTAQTERGTARKTRAAAQRTWTSMSEGRD